MRAKSHHLLARYRICKGTDLPRLKAITHSVGISKQVIFAGFVPDEELPDYYRSADVFAMPSIKEGFGIVFLESMGCGTPVLAGNRDGSVDALDRGRLGKLVDPISIDDIIQSLIEMLRKQGPDLWFDRSALSDTASKKFGRRAFDRKLISLCADINISL